MAKQQDNLSDDDLVTAAKAGSQTAPEVRLPTPSGFMWVTQQLMAVAFKLMRGDKMGDPYNPWDRDHQSARRINCQHLACGNHDPALVSLA